MHNINIDNFIAHRFYDDFLCELSSLKIYKNNYRLPLFNTITAQLKNTNNLNPLYGAGGSISRKKALLSSVGEGIERVCLNFPSHTHHVLCAAYADIADQAINPIKLYGFSDDVYFKLNIDKYEPHVQTGWYKCVNYITDEYKYMPACSIWTNFDALQIKAPVWDKPLSTGTSAHYNYESMILSGILEVIERDTFSLYWENRVSGIHRDFPEGVKQLQTMLQRHHLECEIIYLPNEFGVPVACCVIKDRTGKGPFAAFGAAAKLHWDDAAWRAVEEAILTHIWLTFRMRDQPKSYEDLISLLSDIPDPVVHADIYAAYPAYEHYMSLFNEHNVYTNHVSEIMGDKQLLIERIVEKNFEIYVADITLPQFRDMGYFVSRIMIPGLLPLSRGFLLRHTTSIRHQSMLNNCTIFDAYKKDYFVQPLP